MFKLILTASLMFSSLSLLAQDYAKYAGTFTKGVTVASSDSSQVGVGGETLDWKFDAGVLSGTASGENWEINTKYTPATYVWKDAKITVTSFKAADEKGLAWLWPILEKTSGKATNIAVFTAKSATAAVTCTGDAAECAKIVTEHTWVFYNDAQNFVHHVIVRNYAEEGKRVYRDLKFEK